MNALASSIRIVLPLLFVALASPGASQIRFVDIASRGGVDHVVRNSETPERYEIEPMIAGVALFDYDDDGRLDIYVCNGASIPGLEKTDETFSNRLFRNTSGLEFEDVTKRAGVGGSGYSMGVAAGDYDNDGWVDLYVTGVNRNTLYRNLSNGTFEDATVAAGVGGHLDGYGKAWAVDVYGPKVLAYIRPARSPLPATLEDRTIRITLQRQKRTEKRECLRSRERREATEPLKRKLVRWVEGNGDVLDGARPSIPTSLTIGPPIHGSLS